MGVEDPHPRSRSTSCDSVSSFSSSSSSSSFSYSPIRVPEEEFFSEISVDGLSRNVTSDHLRDIFSQYGYVKSARIEEKPKLGKVKFSTEKAAITAIDCMDGGQIDGNFVRVRMCPSKPNTSELPPGKSHSSSLRLESSSRNPPRGPRRPYRR